MSPLEEARIEDREEACEADLEERCADEGLLEGREVRDVERDFREGARVEWRWCEVEGFRILLRLE